MRKYLATGALGAVMLFTGCSGSSSVSAAVKPDGERKPAPNFTLTDEAGKAVKLSDFKGKVVLLNFWATWCGPCKVEIPWFIEFHNNYHDRDLVILGVSFDDDGWKSVKPYVTDKKINYRIMIGNDDVAKLYGGLDSLPTTLMIDRAGNVAATHVGLISKSDYKSEIESLLESHAKASTTFTVASSVRLRAN